MKHAIQKVLRHLGYEVHRTRSAPASAAGKAANWIGEPAPVDSVWPLPRRPGGLSDNQIREELAKHDLWHYAFSFEGGISVSLRHRNVSPLATPERPLQRFRHFMPYLIAAAGGSLRGKRILDIACNAGFWSIQCALLGADVTAFDGRGELIEEAKLIKSIVGLPNVEFTVLDFWKMSPESLGGRFDIVLNLGILYHLTHPLEALQLTKSMAKTHILLDTTVYPSTEPVIHLRWEEAYDITSSIHSGIATNPSKSGLELMLKHVGAARWFEIPLRTPDMPEDYLENRRASWLVEVP